MEAFDSAGNALIGHEAGAQAFARGVSTAGRSIFEVQRSELRER